jgi:hypothetical protein
VATALHRGAWDATGMPAQQLSTDEILEASSVSGSTWGSTDVLRAICDRQVPVSDLSGHDWAVALEDAASRIIPTCIDLDPSLQPGPRRRSDGRSAWIEPTAAH